MGKGKNKTFKLKEYKVPSEKYVVVVNPWGLPDRIDMNTKLNEIAAWFELLLKKDYPNARVREIFYQKTHRNIIVELPREIDIEKYLGAYHYSQFHNTISPDDTRTAYIYEYRYATFGNPGNKNWSGIIPTNHTIPAGLLQVLKDPFPLPSPAPPPPSDTPYARPVPAKIQCQLTILRDVALIASASEDKGKGKSIDISPPPLPLPLPLPPPSAQAPNVGSSCSFGLPPTESLFTPYEPPSHYVAHVEGSKSRIDRSQPVTHELPKVKMDPYEEDEVATALLRSLSPAKKDEPTEAVDFLNSFLSHVKSEEKPTLVFPSREDSKPTLSFDGDRDYKPSADLLDLFKTVSTEFSTGESSSAVHVVKSEVFDTVLGYDGDSSSDHKDIIIKSEAVETELIQDEAYRPSGELLAAFANLPDVFRYDDQSIKQEPQDLPTGPSKMFSSSSSSSSNRHYSIPRDPRRSLLRPEDGKSDSQSLSRDPRKRPPIKHEKDLEGPETEVDDGFMVFRKRLKMEH